MHNIFIFLGMFSNSFEIVDFGEHSAENSVKGVYFGHSSKIFFNPPTSANQTLINIYFQGNAKLRLQKINIYRL